MPTSERSDQPEDQTKDEKSLPSSDQSNSSTAEASEIKPPRKVAAKKKTARKKVAKKKASQTASRQVQNEQSNSSIAEVKQTNQPTKVAVKKKAVRKKAAKKKTSQTRRKRIQPEPTSGSDQAASVVGAEAGSSRPAEQKPPEKPVQSTVPPVARPAHTQTQAQGATGLMGFWIKVGVFAFVILAGIIAISSFFGADEASSGPEETQASAGAQGENASGADGMTANTGTPPGVAFPPTPHGYGNQPGAFAGAAIANKPAMENAANAAVAPAVSPGAGQAPASQPYVAPPNPRGNNLYQQAGEYRPEHYRPLEQKQDPPPPTQPSVANETPRTPAVPAPSYPQPGAYTYPPAPGYSGYGQYYRY